MMFPKQRPVLNDRLLFTYCETHPRCEVLLCPSPPMPTPHHLVRRPVGGDVHRNLLRLCWSHHVGPEGWHTLGPLRWIARFLDRLTPESRRKVRTATTRHRARAGPPGARAR